MRGPIAAMAVGFGALLGILACSGDDERPPDAELACPEDEQPCITGEGSSGGGTTPSDTDAGTSGGDASAATDEVVRIIGDLEIFTDDDFLQTALFSGDGEVFAQAPDNDYVMAPISGDSFEVEGVLAGVPVWAGFMPAYGSDLLTTILAYDTTAGERLVLPVVQASTFDLMLTGMTQAVTRDEGAAQIVMFFVDENLNPVPNVLVEPP